MSQQKQAQPPVFCKEAPPLALRRGDVLLLDAMLAHDAQEHLVQRRHRHRVERQSQRGLVLFQQLEDRPDGRRFFVGCFVFRGRGGRRRRTGGDVESVCWVLC